MSNLSDADTPAAHRLEYRLTLFVAGEEANSRAAKTNLAELCEVELRGRYETQVVDVLSDFASAAKRAIVVTPTLLVHCGSSERRVIGNLSDRQKLRAALGLGDV